MILEGQILGGGVITEGFLSFLGGTLLQLLMWIEDSGRIERIQIILLMITVSVTKACRVHKQHMVGRESYLYNGAK